MAFCFHFSILAILQAAFLSFLLYFKRYWLSTCLLYTSGLCPQPEPPEQTQIGRGRKGQMKPQETAAQRAAGSRERLLDTIRVLSELDGISGQEGAVRAEILRRIGGRCV